VGERVRAYNSDLTREEHRHALGALEQMAEFYLEDAERSGAFTTTINVKVDGKSIPRCTLLLHKNAPTTIASLVAEIRRRDELLERAVDVIRDHVSGETVLINDILEMLGS